MNYHEDDPRGVLDQVIAFSDAVQRACRIREIGAELKELRAQKCGNCSLWMKSARCPREHNVRGVSRGPSMSAMPCDKFVDGDEPWKARREAALHEELKRIQGASR